MTNKQMLERVIRAKAALKQTTEGYKDRPNGVMWRRAMKHLDALQAALKPKPVVLPDLGPVWAGGKSVLDHDLTHPTSGIPRYPAFDDAFVEGREIIAPEDLKVTRASSSNPGAAMYAVGASGIQYWFGHLAFAPAVGRMFKKGQTMGKVGPNRVGGGPHVHVGVNVEKLLGPGKELEHHTNYTHGAPTVREQLKKLLK